jgi:drug/metabolite transporter (DMT)-like permease
MMIFNYTFVRSFGVFVMDVPKEYQKIIVFRALIGFFGIQGMWASVKYMPVSTANCIFFTLPVWTSIIAFFVLKEKLSKYDVFSIITAFMGVIVINNPWHKDKELSEEDL